eukprot:CAMPEP_0181361322 /NCGR_PEP_ID=MMETSP1106-20121128/7210_1 /TAXON_ID=81844 /ORGANISM="Mantoniella antarctica, Strain SL-175" /LENGTH=214 /DNA_ID=CAMNT_0023474799 /DNA_START=265 /DNA_END=909 /DNA_ORIENTATION=-
MFGINLHGSGYHTAFEALQRDTPKKAARYDSNSEYRAHLSKHLRRPIAPSQEYDAPVTESQKVGWEVERYQREVWEKHKTSAAAIDAPRFLTTAGSGRHPNHQNHHKATEISHYNDCVTKHMYGRSVKSEFGAYGQARLETQALEDHKVSGTASGMQQPVFGRYAPMRVPEPRTTVLGKTNLPMEGTFKASGEGRSYYKANTSRYGEHFLKTCG